MSDVEDRAWGIQGFTRALPGAIWWKAALGPTWRRPAHRFLYEGCVEQWQIGPVSVIRLLEAKR